MSDDGPGEDLVTSFLTSTRHALWDAYRRATYAARTDDGEIRIHPDRRTPDLDTLLNQRRVDQWAYITAYNPGSRLLSGEENVRRQQALVQAVQDRGLTFFEGESVLDAAAWPPEPSLLILGISPDEARALGRQFGQLAIIVGRLDQPARLMACEEIGRRTEVLRYRSATVADDLDQLRRARRARR